MTLRQQSTHEAEVQFIRYVAFFDEQTPEEVFEWVLQMQQPRHWGDHISVRTLADCLGRPLIVWRLEDPNQPPSCFVPHNHDALHAAEPIYLRLEEGVPGAEHYNALLPRAAAAANPPDHQQDERPPKRARMEEPSQADEPEAAGIVGKPKKQTPAEKRGLTGIEALGDWGKLGLTREEYQKLLEWIKELTPQKTMDRLHEKFPDIDEQVVKLKFLKNLSTSTERLEKAENGFSNQKKALALMDAGTFNQDALQAQCPGVGYRFILAASLQYQGPTAGTWKGEFDRRFSVLQTFDPNQTWWESTVQEDTSLVAKAKAWMRTPSWTFCQNCGHREPQPNVAWHWRKNPETCVQRSCPHGCGKDPLELQQRRQQPQQSRRLKAYVTPQASHWRAWVAHIDPQAPENTALHQVLTKEEMRALAPLAFRIEYRKRRGGNAEITSKQKKTLTRARWNAQPVDQTFPSPAARKAYEWLMENNSTYRYYVNHHKMLLQEQRIAPGSLWIHTAELLLNMPGVEVAACPWLYPHASFGDTDLAFRLKQLNQIAQASTPSLKISWGRKIACRSVDYVEDYALHCFLYDVSLARTLSSVVNMAEQKKMAPETFATDMPAFEMYWYRQTQMLEDVVRQTRKLPELFFTVAPAEWKFPLHEGIFPPSTGTQLNSQQILLTLHLYNSLQALLREMLFENGDALAACGIESIDHWCMRFEFQKRGTIHVHVLCWYAPVKGRHPSELTGKTGAEKNSPLVKLLQSVFECSVDVQGGKCSHNLMTYVLGYVSKASDALQFRTKDGRCTGRGPQEETRWRQIYRMLSKRSPLEQEMTMDLACQPTVRSSFTGAFVHAPVPGSKAVNNDRHLYNAFQDWLEGKAAVTVDKRPAAHGSEDDANRDEALEHEENREEEEEEENQEQKKETNFLEWLRKFDIRSKTLLQSDEPSDRQTYHYELRHRNRAGRGRNKICAVAIQFPFELLDIYVGAYSATFQKGRKEAEILPQSHREAPENMAHLAAALKPRNYGYGQHAAWNEAVEKLMNEIADELTLRGLGFSRVDNFRHRTRACAMVLRQVVLGDEDPTLWTNRNLFSRPARVWSPEQQEVLGIIDEGISVTDANELEVSQRILKVTGGPGTGKTEVVIEAALDASMNGSRVLVAAPVGLLVAMYRPADKQSVLALFPFLMIIP